MIKLVILDVDDTLTLSEEVCFHIENEVAQSMGFAPMSRASHQKNWGVMLEIAVMDRFPGIDATEFMNRIGSYVEQYAKDGKLDVISTENMQTISTLRQMGKKIAILTSRTLSEIRHFMHETHSLSSSVEAFYHKDNSMYFKPDPRVFHQALSHFRVSPQEAVYVGDAVTDAIAAKAAGLHFIAVLESGLRKRLDFEDHAVDFFAQKFSDILAYIKK